MQAMKPGRLQSLGRELRPDRRCDQATPVPAASDVLGYAAAAPLTGSPSEILVRVGVDSTPDFDFDFAVIVLC
jgi:hypothetical protein